MAEAKRKLAAILAADVVGYSRLMGQDDRATLEALKLVRTTMSRHIEAHDGRVVNAPGDALLAEFSSAVEAVQAAADVQRDLAEQSADVAEDRRMQVRIGINLGDVLVESDGTLYGDGVNVAARIEGLAHPGSICVSGKVVEEVDGRTDFCFEDIGEHEVKNIARPIRVFRLEMSGDIGEPPSDRAPALPDKPSIAVLPFENMSGDPEQDYFSDGISEDILTELSRYSSLFVIARNSTFAYKGMNKNVRDIGRELAAGYVLEGSVRKAGNRVRITAQLIEAETGNHLWAEKYDRELDDIFALQDEITQIIVAALPRHIESARLHLAQNKAPSDLAAYDYLLQAKIHHYKATKSDNRQAIELYEKAIEIDPNYSEARAWRACTLGQAWVRGFVPADTRMLAKTADDLEGALSQDEDNSECQRLMAGVCIIGRDFDKAAIHQQRALALNPNDPKTVSQMGELLTATGKPEEAFEWLDLAMRLDPNHGDRRWQNYGHALFVARRYDAAAEAYSHMASPSPWARATQAACYAMSGKDSEARAETAKVIAANPDFSIEKLLGRTFYKQQSDIDHHRECLLKAGFPA